MRSIAFILIFLFFCCINTVSGDVLGSGSFTQNYPISEDFVHTASYQGTAPQLNTIHFNDAAAVNDIDYLVCVTPFTKLYGIDEPQEWYDVSYNISSDEVGTGTFGYSQDDAGYVHIIAFFDSGFDLDGYSGAQDVNIIGLPTNVVQSNYWNSIYGATKVFFDMGGVNLGLYGNYSYSYDFSVENLYVYGVESSKYYLDVTRPAGQSSRLIIQNDERTIVNETSIQTADKSYFDYNKSCTHWDIDFIDINGYVRNYDLYFTDILEDHVGIIWFNQTSYIEPELIQIDAELTTYDFTNHIYRILMEYSTDGGANWERLSVAFNSTSVMSSTTECRTATIDSSYYTLPIKIRAVIDDYNKLTSSSSTIATSGEVYYNPPAAYDYIVSGTVFNADNGAVIEGATVSASGVTTTSSTSTVTGKFQLYLSEGYYTINTTKSGYQDNVQTDLLIDHDVSWAQIHLTPIGYGNNTLYGNINDVDTGNAIQDVHVIITNATDQIDAYTSSGGYYEATGLAQSSTYTVRALRTGYHPYNGTVTTEASGASHKSFDMVQVNYSVTPTPTVVSTYPGGEGHEWSNDEIVTMLRVLVPGFFMMMLIFLFIAVILGVTGGGGANGGQRGLGLDEIWKR